MPTDRFRSTGLVRKQDGEYELTADSLDVVNEAVTSWTVETSDGGTGPGAEAGVDDDDIGDASEALERLFAKHEALERSLAKYEATLSALWDAVSDDSRG